MKLRVGLDAYPGVVLFENEQFYDRLTPEQARKLAGALWLRADVEEARSVNFDRAPNYYTEHGALPCSSEP